MGNYFGCCWSANAAFKCHFCHGHNQQSGGGSSFDSVSDFHRPKNFYPEFFKFLPFLLRLFLNRAQSMKKTRKIQQHTFEVEHPWSECSFFQCAYTFCLWKASKKGTASGGIGQSFFVGRCWWWCWWRNVVATSVQISRISSSFYMGNDNSEATLPNITDLFYGSRFGATQ